MLFIRRVVGNSMQPALAPKTIVLGKRLARPKVGDVVVARHGGQEIIKRVTEKYEQQYFLCGDNLAQSTDSRTYGWIAHRDIVGVVLKKWVR